MALDPSKRRFTTSSVSFVNQLPNFNYQVLIGDRLTSSSLPIVLLPIDIPGRGTVNSIVTISDDLERAMERRNLKSSQNTSQFGPLIGLIAFKTLRDVAAKQSVNGKHIEQRRYTVHH